jgi:hypothetical protein
VQTWGKQIWGVFILGESQKTLAMLAEGKERTNPVAKDSTFI